VPYSCSWIYRLTAYDYFSSGKDGIPGTKDDLFPLIPEKELAKTGLILPSKE